jgi:DNA-binding transcriptional ArsR family regulator
MPYQIPSVLRDLVLVDMLELTGSTVAAAQVLNMSQPNVSRRYRRLAAELGLQRNRQDRPGRRFSDAEWMRLLRQGVNRHRLACGVLRLGGPAAAGPWIRRWRWVEWIPLPAMPPTDTDALLQHELLDGVVLHAEPGYPSGSTELIPLAGTEGKPLWLRCRPDPRVLAIAHGQVS